MANKQIAVQQDIEDTYPVVYIAELQSWFVVPF